MTQHYASDFIKTFTEPVYDWFRQYGFIIISLVVIAISVRIIVKSIQAIKAKKWGKIPYGDTNTWFSIDNEEKRENVDVNTKIK